MATADKIVFKTTQADPMFAHDEENEYVNNNLLLVKKSYDCFASVFSRARNTGPKRHPAAMHRNPMPQARRLPPKKSSTIPTARGLRNAEQNPRVE